MAATPAEASRETRRRPGMSVDSGQSEDIENSLTGQGVSDRETTVEVDRSESDEAGRNREAGAGGGGRGR